MLVLTRKVGEGIAIGDDIKIVVMQIKGKQVRLGIKASPQTAVHREEIYQKIQEENRAAAQSDHGAVNQAGAALGQAKNGQLGQAPLRRQGRPSRLPGSSGEGQGGDGSGDDGTS